MRRHRILVGLWLVALLVGTGERAEGGRYTDFSQAELRTLPRLCLAQRFVNDDLESPAVPEPERQRVLEKLGPSFIHYHHYCWALLYMRRAARASDKFFYEQAVDNLNYVIVRAEPTFRPLPGMYFKRGNVLKRLGKRKAAEEEYRNAVRLNPGHTAACAALVQSYLDQGDFEAARAALAQGLKYAPRSKTLAAKKTDLDKRTLIREGY